MTDAYERLMAEQIPTGTFGGARPTTPPGPSAAAAHYADLAAAIASHDAAVRADHDNQPAPPARHLTAVPDTEQDAA